MPEKQINRHYLLNTIPLFIADKCFSDGAWPLKISNVLACLVFDCMANDKSSFEGFIAMAERWIAKEADDAQA